MGNFTMTRVSRFFVLLIVVSLTAPLLAGTINVPADYPTIQQAINASLAGDTIIVSGGPYPERVTINKANITLRGNGTYPILNPACTNGQTVISPTSAGITIKGLTITNSNGILPNKNDEARGIWDGSWTTGYDNLTIDDCKIHDIDCGIRAYGRFLTVTNCELYHCKLAGIHASGNNGSPAAPITIKYNWCHDWKWYTGVAEAYGISVRYDNRIGEISYNYCSGMRMGISYYYGGPRDGLGQLVISHNTIDLDYDSGDGTYKTMMGISFWGTGKNCSNIIIRDNIFANCRWYALYQEGYGAAISGSFQVYNNLFYNNNWFYYSYVYPYQWSGNETYPQAGWNDPPLTAFTFIENLTAQDPQFKYTGNGIQQWRLKGHSPALFAASDGTNIGANQEIPPFQTYVDDDYNPSTPGWGISRFNVLQEAIDAVYSTGTVTVEAGRYPEALDIYKGIELVGNGLPFLDGAPTSTGLAIKKENVVIKGFAINGYEYGIDVATSASADISGCYLFFNAAALRNQNPHQTVNATLNWWGDNSGPGGSGNPVIGNVHYDPWIGKVNRPDGAQAFSPGGVGIAKTGTLKTQIEILSSSASKSSLIRLDEIDGAFPQGYLGFAGLKAINRRFIATPYYINNGQFLATAKSFYSSEDLSAAGIPNGAWLSVRVWDSVKSKWIYAVEKNVNPASENIHQSDKLPDTILGHYGTYAAGGYAWANIDHFSEFAAGQDPTVPIELSVFTIE